MSKNPLDTFLDVYVDHLLDEPPAEIKVESESKLDSAMELQPILQSESSQESEPIQESEPTARSLNELFAEANERLDSELDSSRSPFFQPIISDDLFAEIEQSDAQYKESSDLPPMMLFETIVPFEEESLDEELIKDEPIELESIEDELVEPESSPSRW